MDESPPVRPDAEGISPLLEPLLGVHAATTLPWVADAALTAAERGVGALYSLLYVKDATGDLVGERPASSARMRALGRLNEELGVDLTQLRFDPNSLLAVSSCLRDGHAVAVREISHALPLSLTAEEAEAKQRALGLARAWLVPLYHDGESYGLLLLFMPDGVTATIAEAELLGRHVAVAVGNLAELDSGRKRGELDEVRWIYDEQRFGEQLSMEIHRARRHKRPLSIMLLRVDNFHDTRARYGRFLAERLLRHVGGELETAMRDTDFLAAFRDDGFAAILVEADPSQAHLARQRLTRGLHDIQLPNAELANMDVQLSCATATMPDDGDSPEELAAAAEARLDAEAASLRNAASA